MSVLFFYNVSDLIILGWWVGMLVEETGDKRVHRPLLGHIYRPLSGLTCHTHRSLCCITCHTYRSLCFITCRKYRSLRSLPSFAFHRIVPYVPSPLFYNVPYVSFAPSASTVRGLGRNRAIFSLYLVSIWLVFGLLCVRFLAISLLDKLWHIAHTVLTTCGNCAIMAIV